MKKYWKKNRAMATVTFLLGMCASVFSAGISLLLQEVVDAAVSGKTEIFGKLFIFTAGYILVLCAIHFFSSLAAKYLTEKMIRQYRQDIFRGIMTRSPRAYDQEPTSNYLSALTNDMKAVEENYILVVLNTFELVVMFAVTLGLLLLLSPLVTGILLCTLLLMFLIPAGIGGILEKRQDLVSRQMSVFTGKIKELFSGYEVLKSYCRIENAIFRFQEENDREASVRFRAARLFALNEGLSDTLSVLSTIAVIFVSGYLVLNGQITMGTLLALVQLSSTFMAPVILLMQNIPKIQSMRSVIARLNNYAEHEEMGKTKKGIPTFTQSIEFQQVSFGYQGQKELLSNVNFKIEKGKKYAIMGQSGCGKSTLLKLLAGYFEDYTGEILYDGQELRTLNTDQISQLSSVIHQNVYLFNESIRENILLHEKFSNQELEEALEKSGASLFLEEKGIDAMAGEAGGALSGGQRQRITIARALLRKTPLLILDEATSALDRKTAHGIESRLLQTEGLTLLTITHNPDQELLTKYDEIYDMKNGTLEIR